MFLNNIINPTDVLIQDGVKTFFTCLQKPGRTSSYLQLFKEAIQSRYIPFYAFNKRDEKASKNYIFNVNDCIDSLIKWYGEIQRAYGLESGQELPRFYTARNAFVTLFLLTKHTLEYYLPELPVSVKRSYVDDKAIEWKGAPLTLDDLVGYIWPSLLSITATGIVQEGTEIGILDFRPNIRQLINSTKSKSGADYAIYRVISSPMSFFNLISEDFVYSTALIKGGKAGRYRFLVTGFGSAIKNILQDFLNQSRLTIEDIRKLTTLLNKIANAHIYIINNISVALTENWFSVVRGAVHHVEERGEAGDRYYGKSEAYLDVSAYTLATIGQYYLARELGHKDLVASLAEYLPIQLLDKPREMFENYIKRFIAISTRIW